MPLYDHIPANLKGIRDLFLRNPGSPLILKHRNIYFHWSFRYWSRIFWEIQQLKLLIFLEKESPPQTTPQRTCGGRAKLKFLEAIFFMMQYFQMKLLVVNEFDRLNNNIINTWSITAARFYKYPNIFVIISFWLQLNGIPFGVKSKGKLSPRLYSIQFERKCKAIPVSIGTLRWSPRKAKFSALKERN